MKAQHYLDVVDIDRYDAVLGTVFMHKYGVVLNFENRTISIQRQEIPTYVEVDKATIIANCKDMSHSHYCVHNNVGTVTAITSDNPQ